MSKQEKIILIVAVLVIGLSIGWIFKHRNGIAQFIGIDSITQEQQVKPVVPKVINQTYPEYSGGKG